MDFIAKAGNKLQNINRVTGILLVFLLIQAFFTLSVMQENGRLKSEKLSLSRDQKIYVIPGSMAGVYSPRKMDVLLHAFADHVSQSLKTYTPSSFKPQYLEIRKFFTAKMLSDADTDFAALSNRVSQDSQSSLFIPQRNTLTVEKVPHPKRKDAFLKGVYRVSLIGSNQYSLGGSVIEAAPNKVTMEVQEANISESNPFGYKVRSYSDRELTREEVEAMGLGSKQ